MDQRRNHNKFKTLPTQMKMRTQMYTNLWDIVIAVPTGKYIVVNIYITKEGKPLTNNLILQLEE